MLMMNRNISLTINNKPVTLTADVGGDGQTGRARADDGDPFSRRRIEAKQ